MKQGKRYLEAAKLVESAKAYDIGEAVNVMLQTATAKFDESVELHVKLGVDSRHADQQVRGVVVLPNGTGKTKKILVLAKGAAAEAAKNAGADFVKTSTGFSIHGATIEDVKLMRETVGPLMGVKAAGGVRTHEEMVEMVKVGATRIGTSSGAKLMK